MSRSTMAGRAPATASPTATNGSQTMLQTQLRGQPSDASATLRLRAEPAEQSHVRWADDVVDNEGMGKKSSKVCCIYHKPHEPGDSDSESDSSSDSDDEDSEPDLSRAQASGGNNRRRRRGHNHDQRKPVSNENHGRRPSPNAYEKQPKPQSKG